MQIESVERIDDLHYQTNDDVETNIPEQKDVIPMVSENTNKQEIELHTQENQDFLNDQQESENIADFASNEMSDHMNNMMDDQATGEFAIEESTADLQGSNNNLVTYDREWYEKQQPKKEKKAIKNYEEEELEDDFEKYYSLDSIENPHLGTCKPMFFVNGKPWIVLGPDWPMYILLNIILQGLTAGYLYIFWDTLTGFQYKMTITVDIIQFTIYFKIFLQNPGLATYSGLRAPQDLSYNVKRKYYCRPCRLIRWVGVEHCYDCDVCIQDLDHHCPWTSKCIGKGNMFTFYAFVTTSCGLFLYIVVMTISHVNKQNKDKLLIV